jgi:hypothetical protein
MSQLTRAAGRSVLTSGCRRAGALARQPWRLRSGGHVHRSEGKDAAGRGSTVEVADRRSLGRLADLGLSHRDHLLSCVMRQQAPGRVVSQVAGWRDRRAEAPSRRRRITPLHRRSTLARHGTPRGADRACRLDLAAEWRPGVVCATGWHDGATELVAGFVLVPADRVATGDWWRSGCSYRQDRPRGQGQP